MEGAGFRQPDGRQGAQASPRFLGVQWRFLLSHLEAAAGASVLAALLVGGPLVLGRDLKAAALFGLVALLLATLGGTWLALRSARDVKLRLREASRFASALARGDYRSRINLRAGKALTSFDEIDRLADELNAMADSLEAAIADLRALAERNRRLAEESGRLAALEERTRLARDLHDTVNQQVFSLSMQAAAARRLLAVAGEDRERLSEAGTLLAEVEELARSAHRQMRDLILQLRPTTLEQQGLGPALEEYARTFAEAEGLKCVCRIQWSGRFGPAVEEALFRIAQEALNNVAKHSGARNVEVSLGVDSSRRVVLAVRDDGRGFDPTAGVRPTALGLKGLRERATALGGQVRIDSAPGRGTGVEVSFPVADAAGPGAGRFGDGRDGQPPGPLGKGEESQ